MKRIRSMPTIASSAKGINDKNTVSLGPDNGANACMRSKFWQVMGHSTTAQAVSNILSRFPALSGQGDDRNGIRGSGYINVGGHGNEGFFETGYGQNGTPDYRTNFFATWNSAAWRPELAKLANMNFPSMFIYSCHTGAGEAGADLLYMMALVLNRPVAGRTGFTYCGGKGITFEAGSTWQVATPQGRPTPIPAPSAHITLVNRDTMAEIVVDQSIYRIEAGEIKSLSVDSSSFLTRGTRRDFAPLPKELYQSFLDAAFGSEPMKLPGAPTAMITGRFRMEFKYGNATMKRLFLIYNDRLVVDEVMELAYYATPGLMSLMKSIE